MPINLKNPIFFNNSCKLFFCKRKKVLLVKSNTLSFVFEPPVGIGLLKNKNKLFFIFDKQKKIDIHDYSCYLLINKFFKGVNLFFTKVFLIKGLGYKVFYDEKNNILSFKIGYSHIVNIQLNYFMKAFVQRNNKLVIKSPVLDLLGSFTNRILKIKKIDYYKGKGVLLKNKIISLKQGKKA